LISTGWFQERI